MGIEKIIKSKKANNFFYSSLIDIDSQINLVESENIFVKDSISRCPILKEGVLKPCYEKILKQEKFIYEYACMIDGIDRITSIVRGLGNFSDGFLAKASLVAKGIEYCVKIPFIVYIYNQSQDIGILASLTANEVISLSMPFADAINLFDFYKDRVKKHIRDSASIEYTKFLLDNYSESK